MNFVTPILWNMLPRILRARHSEIVVLPPHGTGKKEIHDALEQHPPRLPSNIQFGMVYGEPVAGTENKRYKCSVTYGTLYSHTLPLPKEIEVPKEYRYHPHLHTYCCAFLTGYIGAGLPKTTDKALNAGYAAGKSAGIQAREAQAEGAKRRADHHSDPSSRR